MKKVNDFSYWNRPTPANGGAGGTGVVIIRYPILPWSVSERP